MRADQSIFGLIAIVASFVASAMFAGRAHAQTLGWTYTTRTDVDTGAGVRISTGYMRSESTAHGYRATLIKRSMSPTAATSPTHSAADPSYILMNDVDSTVTSVSPSRRSTVTIGHAAREVAEMLSGLKHGTTQKTTSDVIDLGDGGFIVGHATRHVRFTAVRSAEWSLNDDSCTQRFNIDTELWIAPDLSIEKRATWLRKLIVANQMPGVASDPASALATVDAARSKQLPKGEVLRARSKTTQRDSQGRPRVSTTTVEVVQLTHGRIADSTFVVPAGYRKLDSQFSMAKMPAGLRRSMDSTLKATRAKLFARMCGRATNP